MKKVLVLLVGLGLVISCDKEEALDDSSSTFDTTSIMAIVESGNNNTSRDVNRPGSVLDWINTIEISADHVGTIGGPYKVSDIYTMKDDGSGDDNFILEDVALGQNKFEALALSYQQDPAEEFKWVAGEADTPWEWVDAQRGRAPNTNFRDTDNAIQFIYENPTAAQNVVKFDMKAESGRLIVAVRLSDAIRNQFFSNYVYVDYRVKYADGSTSNWNGLAEFNSVHKDDLLTFYFSDNTKSLKDACVEFSFNICDSDSTPTNTFTREICIPDNGKSVGCVYEIDENAVIENVTDFNFTFLWEELDCSPCASNNYVTTLPRYQYIQNEMLDLCGSPVGSYHDITDLVDPITDWHEQVVLNLDLTASNVSLVKSGTDRANPLVMSWGAGSITIPIGKTYLVVLPENATIGDIIVDNYNKGSRTTGAIKGCE